MKKSLIVAVLLICAFSLSGCSKIVFSTGFNEDTMLKISGEKYSTSEAVLMLLIEKDAYEESFGDDVWSQTIDDMTMEEYLKSAVKEKMIQTETKCLLADEEDVTLTDDEIEEADETAEEEYEELEEYDLDSYGIDLELVKELYNKYALADKVYDSIVDSLTTEVSDADTKIIEVQYIYIDNSEDDDAAYEKAEEAYEKVEDGYDFESVAEEYSDDDEIDYVFGKGETYEEFEDAAYDLEDDEISDIVETENGYYIIKCIEDYMVDETEENREEITAELEEEGFNEVYTPFLEDLTIEFNDNLWDKLDIF